MKKCPWCGKEYPDEALVCAIDQRPLEASGLGAGAPARQDSAISDTLPPEMAELECDVPPDGEAALCTHCLFPNLPEALWCKRCGAPVSFASMFGPMDAIRASGFTWRGATQGRPTRFILMGVWLIFLPMLLGNLSNVYANLTGYGGGLWAGLYLWWSLFNTAIALAMLYQVTRNYVTLPPTPRDDPAV